jgi:elongation factor Ts
MLRLKKLLMLRLKRLPATANRRSEGLLMAVTAAMVKELRARTGAGMMECKKALVESDGDLTQAADGLRKSGQAKADKKAGRIAAEGQVAIRTGGSRSVILEANSETDFVAKDENFQQFIDTAAAAVLRERPADVEALMNLPQEGGTFEQARAALIAKVGENIAVRRFDVIDASGPTSHYIHGSRIGVVVELSGGDDALAKDIAMHVAASNPAYVSADDVPADQVAKEREILSAQAAQEGKPENIIAKMVEGRLRKFLSEITLTGQPFVKDPDTTVGNLLQEAGASVTRFVRYEVGEGIEKKADNFVEEVMAQVSQSQD